MAENIADASIRVKALREKYGLNHGELAQLAGIPAPSQISRIEGGRNNVSSIEMRMRLAQGFGLTLQELCHYLDGDMSVDRACAIGYPRIKHKLQELRHSWNLSRAEELEMAIGVCGGAMKLGPVVPVVRHIAAQGIEQSIDGWCHTIRYFEGKIDRILNMVQQQPSVAGKK